MDWNLVITGVVSAITGGGLATFLTFKLGNRKQDESEFITLVKEYKGMVEGYKIEVIELRKGLAEVRALLYERDAEVTQLRNQLMIFESSNVDVPVPIWLKDTEGKMLFVNPEYDRSVLQPIGKTTEDYIGKKDDAIWGPKIAKAFQANDKKVMRSKKPMEFTERFTGQNGVIMEGRLIKYPRFLNRTVIGIGGIIVDMREVQGHLTN